MPMALQVSLDVVTEPITLKHCQHKKTVRILLGTWRKGLLAISQLKCTAIFCVFLSFNFLLSERQRRASILAFFFTNQPTSPLFLSDLR